MSYFFGPSQSGPQVDRQHVRFVLIEVGAGKREGAAASSAPAGTDRAGALGDEVSGGGGEDAGIAFGVGFEDVLEDRRAFQPVDVGAVGGRQAGVEGGFDHLAELGAG